MLFRTARVLRAHDHERASEPPDQWQYKEAIDRMLKAYAAKRG